MNNQPRNSMREFETGATRDQDEDKLDFEGFLSPLVLERYAEYMHKNRKQADGKLRASDNWQKGIPLSAYMKSKWRHFMESWKIHRAPNGIIEVEEMAESLCAELFNTAGYLHEILQGKERGKKHWALVGENAVAVSDGSGVESAEEATR